MTNVCTTDSSRCLILLRESSLLSTGSPIESPSSLDEAHRRRLGFFSALMTSGSFTMMQAGSFRRRLSEYELDIQSTHETHRRRLACASGSDISSVLCKGKGADVSCVVPGNAPGTSGRRRLAYDPSTLFFRLAGVVNLLLGGLKSDAVDTSKCIAPQKKNFVGPGSSSDTDPDCFLGEQALVVRLVEMYEGVCEMPGVAAWNIKECTINQECNTVANPNFEKCDQAASPIEASACVSYTPQMYTDAEGNQDLLTFASEVGANDTVNKAILADYTLLVTEKGFPSDGTITKQEQCGNGMLQHYVESMAGFGRVPHTTLGAKTGLNGMPYIQVQNTMVLPLFQGCGTSFDAATRKCTYTSPISLWDSASTRIPKSSAQYKFFEVQSTFVLGVGSSENVPICE